MKDRERDILRQIAKLHNATDRIRVVLPYLPRVRPLAEDREKVFQEEWDEWERQVEELKVDALYALAKERDADVNELAKVMDLVLDVVPPKFTGKKGKDSYRILLLVALEMHKGKSQKVACDLAGVDVKTFRRYMSADQTGWKIAQHVVSVSPENKLRKSLEIPAEE
jgi:hypothetical protein